MELLMQAPRISDGICRTETIQLVVNKIWGWGLKMVLSGSKYRKREDALCPSALTNQSIDREIENWNGGENVQ
jgi:hypothetical protein